MTHTCAHDRIDIEVVVTAEVLSDWSVMSWSSKQFPPVRDYTLERNRVSDFDRARVRVFPHVTAHFQNAMDAPTSGVIQAGCLTTYNLETLITK